jgi:dUTP pyrophosphatase
MVKIKVRKLKKNAVLPRYVRVGDAAMDLVSTENYLVKPGERVLVSTGIACELPEGYLAYIWGRSGLALKKGIAILGGVIECTYRGEYGVIVLNTGDEDFEILVGDRIAQVVIQPVVTVDVVEVDELGNSIRGDAAWGSSGR